MEDPFKKLEEAKIKGMKKLEESKRIIANAANMEYEDMTDEQKDELNRAYNEVDFYNLMGKTKTEDDCSDEIRRNSPERHCKDVLERSLDLKAREARNNEIKQTTKVVCGLFKDFLNAIVK